MNNGFNRRLGLDVSQSEMMAMRNSGLNNRRIAERLGVSIQTVYKYIGKQPTGMPREHRTAVGQFCKTQSDKPTVVQIVNKPALTLVSTVSLLKGETSEYRIDSVQNIVEISGLLNGILDPTTIDQTIKELTEIKNAFASMKM